jgi:hypothetical protein
VRFLFKNNCELLFSAVTLPIDVACLEILAVDVS